MANENQRPDVKKFLEDPAHQGDRELMFGVIEAFLEKKSKEAKEKETQEGEYATNIFDEMFGGKKRKPVTP